MHTKKRQQNLLISTFGTGVEGEKKQKNLPFKVSSETRIQVNLDPNSHSPSPGGSEYSLG